MDVQAVEVGSGCSDRNRNRHVTVNIMRSRCYRGLWIGVVAHIRTRRALGRIILTVNILFGTGIERRTDAVAPSYRFRVATAIVSLVCAYMETTVIIEPAAAIISTVRIIPGPKGPSV